MPTAQSVPSTYRALLLSPHPSVESSCPNCPSSGCSRPFDGTLATYNHCSAERFGGTTDRALVLGGFDSQKRLINQYAAYHDADHPWTLGCGKHIRSGPLSEGAHCSTSLASCHVRIMGSRMGASPFCDGGWSGTDPLSHHVSVAVHAGNANYVPMNV